MKNKEKGYEISFKCGDYEVTFPVAQAEGDKKSDKDKKPLTINK